MQLRERKSLLGKKWSQRVAVRSGEGPLAQDGPWPSFALAFLGQTWAGRSKKTLRLDSMLSLSLSLVFLFLSKSAKLVDLLKDSCLVTDPGLRAMCLCPCEW